MIPDIPGCLSVVNIIFDCGGIAPVAASPPSTSQPPAGGAVVRVVVRVEGLNMVTLYVESHESDMASARICMDATALLLVSARRHKRRVVERRILNVDAHAALKSGGMVPSPWPRSLIAGHTLAVMTKQHTDSAMARSDRRLAQRVDVWRAATTRGPAPASPANGPSLVSPPRESEHSSAHSSTVAATAAVGAFFMMIGRPTCCTRLGCVAVQFLDR